MSTLLERIKSAGQFVKTALFTSASKKCEKAAASDLSKEDPDNAEDILDKNKRPRT